MLGRLSETLVLTSAFRLTPWVASVPYPYPYVAAPREVEEILHVPFAALLAPAAHRIEPRRGLRGLLDTHNYTRRRGHDLGRDRRILRELLAVWRTL